ncbi:MAG TPA: NUDIX domain-containing protein [Gemmatimonadales bacterium]|nr:NUDIX domain-containing protein [Gemmatimonadales bacterium]
MTTFRVTFVDVYPLRGAGSTLEVVALRRAPGGRCSGAWEVVHGSIEEGETPHQAALRELREETGLAPERLYNLSRVETFYRHRVDEVAFIPVFAAFCTNTVVRLSSEHDAFEWLSFPAARECLAWPRERRALKDIEVLLGRGNAGELEDVLRIAD